jgi:hypothetical protein
MDRILCEWQLPRVWKQKQPNQSEYTNIMTNRPHMLKFIHELLVGLHVSQQRRRKKKKTTPPGASA